MKFSHLLASQKSTIAGIFSVLRHLGIRNYWVIVLLSFLSQTLDVLGIASLIPLFTAIFSENANSPFQNWRWLNNLIAGEGSISLAQLMLMVVPVLFISKNIVAIMVDKKTLSWTFNISQKLAVIMVEKLYHKGYEQLVMQNTFVQSHRSLQMSRQFAVVSLKKLLQLNGALLSLCIVMVLTLVIQPVFLAVVLAMFIPIGYWFWAFYAPKMQKIGKERHQLLPKNAEWLHKLLESYIEFTLYQAKSLFFNLYRYQQLAINQMNLAKQTTSVYPKRLLEVAAIIAICLLGFYYVVWHEDIAGFITTSGLFAVVAYKLIPAFVVLMQSSIDLTESSHIIAELKHSLQEENTAKSHLNQNAHFQQEWTCKHLSKKLQDKVLFHEVYLTIPKAQIIGIKGASGSGKSTLMKVMMGFLPADGGEVWLDDKRVEAPIPGVFGYIGANSALLNTSVYENVSLKLDYTTQEQNRVDDCLRRAELGSFIGEKRSIGQDGVQLSTGEQQRLALARVLFHQPDIIVLDEFTANLDNQTEQKILNTLSNLQKSIGLTICLVSHHDSVLSICDLRYELKNGKLLKCD